MTDERCDLSDLLVTECACPMHKTPDPLWLGRLTWLSAHFWSSCGECGQRMYEGDRIARTEDGDYICEECGNA